MMTVQRVAQVFGIVFLLVGILGFVSTGMSMDANPETAPRLLGLFPVNALHNVVHLLFGVWGLVASRSFGAAKIYGTVGGVTYLALAALAFVDPTTFGLIPIGSHNIWLHAVLGAGLLGASLTARDTAGATAV